MRRARMSRLRRRRRRSCTHAMMRPANCRQRADQGRQRRDMDPSRGERDTQERASQGQHRCRGHQGETLTTMRTWAGLEGEPAAVVTTARVVAVVVAEAGAGAAATFHCLRFHLLRHLNPARLFLRFRQHHRARRVPHKRGGW